VAPSRGIGRRHFLLRGEGVADRVGQAARFIGGSDVNVQRAVGIGIPEAQCVSSGSVGAAFL
jgi:hypothetical protein